MPAHTFLFILALKCEVVAHSCCIQSGWSVRVRNGNVHMQYICTIYRCASRNLVDGVIRTSASSVYKSEASKAVIIAYVILVFGAVLWSN
jgi:hypothetical protein